jgi:hypothetical protein
MEGETRGHFAGIGEVILEPYKLAQLAFPDRAMKWVVPKHLTFHDENTVGYASSVQSRFVWINRGLAWMSI